MPKSTKTTQSTTTTRTRTRKPRTTSETPDTQLSATVIPETGTTAAVDHDAVAQRAYELFLDSGARHGRDLEHWLQAESELRQRSFITRN